MCKISSTKVFFVLFLTMLFFSCASTKKTVAAKESTKEASNSYKTKYIRDTVLIRDSSVTSVRNDTIFAEKWHTKYIAKIVKDTVRLNDTVFLTKTVTKITSPQKPSLKEKVGGFILTTGIIILFLFIFYLLIRLKKWK